MSNVSTFGAFTMAKLGIYASQKAMQVTGNNITNINTKGYTRQSVDLTSLYVGGADRYASKWDAKVGSGVLVDGISQIRSPYLDIRYRTENSTTGFEDTLLTGLRDLSRVLDEVAGGEDDEGVLEAALQDMIEQLEKYNTENSNELTFDEIFKGSAKQVVNIFNTYARKLEDVKNNQEKQFKADVEIVNDILSKIQSLNISIQKAEVHGSNALELKDERNLLIDDLSKYIRINVLYEAEDVGAGQMVDKLVIKLDSNDMTNTGNHNNAVLVDGKYVTQLIAPDVKIPLLENGESTTPEEYEDKYDWYDSTHKTFPEYGIAFDILRDAQGKPAMEVEGRQATFSSGEKTRLENGVLVNKDGIPLEGGYTIDAAAKTLEEQLRDYVKQYNAAHKDGPMYASIGNQLDRIIYTVKEEMPVQDADGNPILDDNGQPIIQEPAGAGIVADGITPVPKKQEEIPLTDNDLYGALQASRELLTEEGEFASTKDLEMDANARGKYGIPYYQHLLDNMANKFATLLNEANTLTDANGDLQQNNGVYIVPPQYYYKTSDADEILDSEGNIKPLDRVTYIGPDGKEIKPDGAWNDPYAYKTFKKNEAGQFVDKNGNPITQDVNGNPINGTETNPELYREYKKQEFVFKNPAGTPPTKTINAYVDAQGNPILSASDLASVKLPDGTVSYTDAQGKEQVVPAESLETEGYLQDANGNYLDANGNVIEGVDPNNPDTYMRFVFNKNGQYVDAQGNPLPKNGPEHDPYNLYKKDADGNYIAADGTTFAYDENNPDWYKDGNGNDLRVLSGNAARRDVRAKGDRRVVTGDIREIEGDKRVVREEYKGGILFSNSGDTDNTEGITAKNISIGLSWSTGAVTALQNREPSGIDHSTPNSGLLHILSILKDNTLSYKANDIVPDGSDVEYFKGNFGDMLTKIGSTLGTQTSLCQSRLANTMAALNELGVDRDSVSGVDLNDEAIAMMQYNKSYSAACRFMTTLDEMLDKLINGTAI